MNSFLTGQCNENYVSHLGNMKYQYNIEIMEWLFLVLVE